MSEQPADRRSDFLTTREAQTLTFVAHGFTPAETATALGISPRSVQKYLMSGKAMINAHTRAEIVEWAIRSGLFPSRPAFLQALVEPGHDED